MFNAKLESEIGTTKKFIERRFPKIVNWEVIVQEDSGNIENNALKSHSIINNIIE